jgi:adenylate kinase family enzyme
MGGIRRIYITGGAGSGKTTLAKSLAGRTDFPFFELDTVIQDYEGSGELETAEVRLRSMIEIASKPEWIAEGNFVGFAQEIWKQAGLIVFIESNLRTTLWRIF